MKCLTMLFLLLCASSPRSCQTAAALQLGDFDYMHGLEPRELKAASPAAALANRDFEVFLRDRFALHYVDGMSDPSFTANLGLDSLGPCECLPALGEGLRQAHSPMGVQVSLASEVPTLLLEENEHLLDSVECDDGRIRLVFMPDAFEQAKEVLAMHQELLIITSHHSCNEKGSRLPYRYVLSPFLRESSEMDDRASKGIFFDSSSIVELSLERVAWDKGYHMSIDFGSTTQNYHINRHDHLRRRSLPDEALSTTTATASASLITATASTQSTNSTPVAFPTADPAASPTATMVNDAIATSYIDTPILPPAPLKGLSVAGLQPEDLTVTCRNCSTFGNIMLTRGTLSTASPARLRARRSGNDMLQDLNNTFGDVKEGIAFIDHGFVELQTTNGLGAHVELAISWTPSESGSYTITLATMPLHPFAIPEIAVIGPQVRFELELGASVSTTLNFTTGFTIAVPDNSTAIAAWHPVNASNATGFDRTTFAALPFSAEQGDVSLNVSAALRAEVLVGASLMDGMATAGAGVFLDLPRLALDVQHMRGVDAGCEPSTDSTLLGEIDKYFGGVAHVAPKVEIAAGMIAQANLSVGNIGVQAAWTPLVTSWAAPTSCLAFDKEKRGYVPASTALAAVRSSEAATAASAAAAAATSTGAAASEQRVGEQWDTIWRVGLIWGLGFLGGCMLL